MNTYKICSGSVHSNASPKFNTKENNHNCLIHLPSAIIMHRDSFTLYLLHQPHHFHTVFPQCNKCHVITKNSCQSTNIIPTGELNYHHSESSIL